MNQGQARVSSKTSLPPRFPATPEVQAGRLFVQSGHPAEAAPSRVLSASQDFNSELFHETNRYTFLALSRSSAWPGLWE